MHEPDRFHLMDQPDRFHLILTVNGRPLMHDVRGSMPDLVQAVGRALRIQPGQGKTAFLVVPVLLGPGETVDNMLTSRAYSGLAKLLEALRAHDTRVVEALARAASTKPRTRRTDPLRQRPG
ncbi:hypothetical protein ACWEN3_13800 [Streptomyces sp. NPDC004561]